jgi:ATP-dependent protease ClpP protease subunit
MRLATLSLIALLWIPTFAAAQAWSEECVVTVELTNVRAAPGTRNIAISQLTAGARVVWWRSEYDIDGSIWHRIPLADGRHGFVSAENVHCNFELKPDLIDGHRTIALYGEIEDGYAESLRVALSQLQDTPIVLLQSEGGNLLEAMAAGDYLRRAGAAVTVNSYCASACLFVLAGGVYRVTNMSAKLGLHRAFLPTRDLSPSEREDILVLTRQYLEHMGVNPVFADIADAFKGAPTWLNEAQLFDLGLITDMAVD